MALVLRNVKGSRLTFTELDGNFTQLQSLDVSGVTYNNSTNLFTLTLNDGSTLTTTIVASGGTGSDKFVSGGTYNLGTQDINFVGNSAETTFDVDLSSLVSSVSGNTEVTGYTYDSTNNTFTITDNDGGSFSATVTQMSGLTVSPSSGAADLSVEAVGNNASITLKGGDSKESFVYYEDNAPGSSDWKVGRDGAGSDAFKWATGTTFSTDTVMSLRVSDGQLDIERLRINNAPGVGVSKVAVSDNSTAGLITFVDQTDIDDQNWVSTGNDTYKRIADGNVGLGTSTPQYRLSINETSTGTTLYNDTGRTVTGISLAWEGDRGFFGLMTGTTAGVTNTFISYGDDLQDKFQIGHYYSTDQTWRPSLTAQYQGGGEHRIGIMTEDPQETLHISGNTRMDGDTTVNGTLTLTDVGSTTLVTNIGIDSSGNVISGTTAAGPDSQEFLLFDTSPASPDPTIIYDDGNVRIIFDDSTSDDVECIVLTNPSSGDVHFSWWEPSDGTAGAADVNTGSGTVVLNSLVDNDDFMQMTVFAPEDSSYPYYEMRITKSNGTYTNIPAVIRVSKWNSIP